MEGCVGSWAPTTLAEGQARETERPTAGGRPPLEAARRGEARRGEAGGGGGGGVVPRRGGSGRAGGAAPEESASGRGGRRLAPPRGTERAARAPATETPAAGGASTSEEAAEPAQRWERDWGWGDQPGRGEGHPLVLCPRAPPGPGEWLGVGGRTRARGGGRARARWSARPCPAGAALWRAGHPACSGKRCG
jgi:hypothetical protein